ncbi:MAG: sulfatase-like hydrolase/transferase [Rikenellaceae bacterium]
MRREILLLCTAVLAPAAAAVAQQRPNVILIMADDLGYGDISCFGNKSVNTPNIDRMAAEGVKMTDFHTNGAVSSPTRAALMTGRYQQRSGVIGVITAADHRDDGLALEEYTMAEAFKDCGYTTAMFGKWHLGYAPRFNPTKQGFDIFEGYVAGNIDYHSHIDQAMYDDWWSGDNLQEEEGYVTDLIGEKAVNFIAEHKDEPFFLYLPHEAPHYPLQGRNSPAIRGDKAPKNQPRQTPEQTAEIYKEMIEVMDETIGDVLVAIEESGIKENTIVIFISDNGGTASRARNLPFSGGKGGVLEGGHRVPAVMWSPGIELSPMTPYIYSSTVMTMDLFPSLINLVGGSVPKNLDGVDFLTPLKKGKDVAKRDLFWATEKQQAMRQGDWKMVKAIDSQTARLYNLANDVTESNDLSAQEPKRYESMKKSIEEWYIEVQPK